MRAISAVLGALLRLIFPPRCACCGTVLPPRQVICGRCSESLPVICGESCIKCGREKSECVCGRHRVEFDGAFVPFYYEGAAKRGVRRFKFSGKPEGAEVFARYAAVFIRQRLQTSGTEVAFDLVTSVPMTASELKSRGYNQAEEFAKAFAKELKLPYHRLLKKPYDTRPQRSCGSGERWGNVFGAFEAVCPEGVDLSGRVVLLCDDILTTGATLSEGARMLKLAGAAKVYVAAAACVKFGRRAEESAV